MSRLKKVFETKYILSALSAVLIFLSFPDYYIDSLIWISMVPLWHALMMSRSLKQAFFCGLIAEVLVMFGGFYWIVFTMKEFGDLPYPVGTALFSFFSTFGALNFPLFTMAFYVLAKKFRNNHLILILGGTILWTGIEFIVPKIFPWHISSCIYSRITLIQAVDIFGVPFLSFCVVLVNVTAYFLIIRFLENLHSEKKVIAGVLFRYLLPVVLVFGFLGIYGSIRVHQMDTLAKEPEKSSKVALVQANIGNAIKLSAEKGYSNAIGIILSAYFRMTKSARQLAEPDLLIWPETAFPMHFHNAGSVKYKMYELVNTLKTPLIFGTFEFENDGTVIREYNGALLIEPDKNGITGKYFKNNLLMFGEYFPLSDTFPWLKEFQKKYVPAISDFSSGHGPDTIEVNGIKMGMIICYEALMPEYVRQTVKIGSDVILNLTNDSWFGNTSEPYQHNSLVVFRAVENRVPIIRATNTGQSSFFDLNGRIRSKSPLMKEFVLVDTVVTTKPVFTIYKIIGELFGWIMLTLVFVILAICIILLKKEKHHES